MTTRILHDLAADLQHGLGLVHQLIVDVEGHRAGALEEARLEETVRALQNGLRFMELPTLLLRAHAEIGEAVGSLRISRELIEGQTIGRLRLTNGKLGEVNTTAETAAMALMSGVDAALQHVEAIDPDDAAVTAGARDALRDELFGLYGHLQFQDITSQQLQGVAAQLAQLEARLLLVAGLFEPGVLAPDASAGELPEDTSALPYNPDAVLHTSQRRQADIDALVASVRG
jgi:hypothetical protein